MTIESGAEKTDAESQVPAVLGEKSADYVSSAAKAVLGAVPFAGSLLAELAGTIIPNQRIERIVKFAAELDQRIRHLEEESVRNQLADESFTDLMEEAIRQAARSISDERRGYLASVIANGLASAEIEYAESKHLLRILGELNDVEVIQLRFFLDPALNGDKQFREQHKEIIFPPNTHIGSSKAEVEKAALFESYREHLATLGLLAIQYRVDHRTKQPEYDSRTGAQKVSGYVITPLGRLLLEHIGLANG